MVENTIETILALIKIIDKGIMMETNAREFYLKAALKVSSKEGREMLRWLAEFEEGHKLRLLNKRQQLLNHPIMMNEPVPGIPNLALSEASNEVIIGTDASDIQILKIALENEKRAYSFFQRKITYSDDPSTRTLFEEMANDENRHMRIIREQIDHIKRTKMWADFKEYEDKFKKSASLD